MNIINTYHALAQKYGRQGWWPILIMTHESRSMTQREIRNNLKYGIPYAKLDDYTEVFRDPYFEIAV